MADSWESNRERDYPQFSCPMFKNNPLENLEDISYGFRRIRDVKQHLMRCHVKPRCFCRRCKPSHPADADLQRYQKQNPECELRGKRSQQWLNEIQEKYLGNLKSSSHRYSGDYGKEWRELYRALFPKVDKGEEPDPFFESNEASLKHLGRQLVQEEGSGAQREMIAQPPVSTALPAFNDPSIPELPIPEQTKEDDLPYTDSGYESIRGPAQSSMQEDYNQESDPIEDGHASMTGDVDGTDDNTSYSVATAILPDVAEKCLVDVCNNIISRLGGSVKKRTLMSLSKILPDLLKAFAIRLGSETSHHSNLRVMHFVHKHHKYIISRLQKEFDFDEIESPTPMKSLDAMPLSEIISMWNENRDKEVAVAEPSEYFKGVSGDEDDGGCVNEDVDVPILSEYSLMITNSAAYDWLISSLVKEASFHWDESQPRTMVDQIRQEILSQLPTGRISSRRLPDQHTVLFKIPRSSLPFLQEASRPSPTRNSATTISDRIVAISSSSYHVQLSNLSQYMEQTWPSGGAALLSLLQNLINGSEQAKNSCNLDGNVKIKLLVEGSYLEAVITGTSYAIAGYGEQLAWLTAALQPAGFDHSIYVRPFIRRVEDESPTRGAEHRWIIGHWREKPEDADVTVRYIQEWQSKFKSPVIVRGYPTLSRPEDCPGIEIPSRLPASLLPIPSRGRRGVRVLLKSTGKILQLFDQTNGVAVWHIIKSPVDACACPRRFMKDDDKDTHPYFDFVEIRQHRHIIIECAVSQMYYEPTDPETRPEIGGAEITQRECSLSETPRFTPYPEDATDSSDSLDEDMLSIPDCSEYSAGEPPDTDDAHLVVVDGVGSGLVSGYRLCTEQHNPKNGYTSYTKQCNPGGHQSSTTNGSSQSTLGVATAQPGSTNNATKRSANKINGDGDGDSEGDSEGDEDPQGTPPRKKQRKTVSSRSSQFFACPFWKQNPDKHRNCYGKKLRKINRVKQHLTRTHHPEFYCERCFVVFPSEDSKHIHLREVCLSNGAAQLDGITSQQHKKLSRKSDKSSSEPEKWYAVWDIVFPGLCHPRSPYLDLERSQDLNNFWEFSDRHGPTILIEVMRKEGVLAPGLDEKLFHKAASCALESLRSRGTRDGHAIVQSSNSEGTPSKDAPGCQQRNGQQFSRASRLTGPSSNTDSGVELRSHLSSGPSRDGANIPRYTSIQPRLTSDRGPQIVAPALNNSGDATIRVPSAGAIQPQLFNEPVPIETAHVDTATQSGENHFDHQSLNTGFGTEWTEDPNLGFDMNEFLMNLDMSGFRSS